MCTARFEKSRFSPPPRGSPLLTIQAFCRTRPLSSCKKNPPQPVNEFGGFPVCSTVIMRKTGFFRSADLLHTSHRAGDA